MGYLLWIIHIPTLNCHIAILKYSYFFDEYSMKSVFNKVFDSLVYKCKGDYGKLWPLIGHGYGQCDMHNSDMICG